MALLHALIHFADVLLHCKDSLLYLPVANNVNKEQYEKEQGDNRAGNKEHAYHGGRNAEHFERINRGGLHETWVESVYVVRVHTSYHTGYA